MFLGAFLGIYFMSMFLSIKIIFSVLIEMDIEDIFDMLDYMIFALLIIITYPFYLVCRIIYRNYFMYIDDMDVFEIFLLIKHRLGRI